MTKPATTIGTIATSCIAGRLRLLNRVITNLYDDALRPLGVKLSQGNVPAVTAKLGVARPAEVCDILEAGRCHQANQIGPGQVIFLPGYLHIQIMETCR